MRVRYAERQAILVDAVRRDLEGAVDVNPSESGLHLIGWLPPGLDDGTVSSEAGTNGVDVWPLSLHALHPYPRAALLLGYASLTPLEIHGGVRRLDRALRSVRGDRSARPPPLEPILVGRVDGSRVAARAMAWRAIAFIDGAYGRDRTARQGDAVTPRDAACPTEIGSESSLDRLPRACTAFR